MRAGVGCIHDVLNCFMPCHLLLPPPFMPCPVNCGSAPVDLSLRYVLLKAPVKVAGLVYKTAMK